MYGSVKPPPSCHGRGLALSSRDMDETLGKTRLGVVGTGVMAEAMIAGLINRKLIEAKQIICSHPREDRRKELQERHGVHAVANNTEAVKDCDIVLLAVKPQMLGIVMPEIKPKLNQKQLLISIIAGATTNALQKGTGISSIVRSMPNTPAQIGKGVSVWFATNDVTKPQREQANIILSGLGRAFEVKDENQVAMATAVSGTGPTYIFLFIEALIDAAVHLGFPRHVARELVLDTMQGSAEFALQSRKHVAELRDMVTSPGGTSAAALYELEKGRLRTVVSDAVWAAFRRTQELEQKLES